MNWYRALTTIAFYKQLTFKMSVRSFFSRLHLRLAGADIGKNVKFYGKAKFILNKSARITIGDDVVFRSSKYSNLIGINRPCIVSLLSDNAALRIGSYCGFSGTVIGCFSSITIGRAVKCGANTLLTDGDWHPTDPRSGDPKPVVIEDNVWLGANVSVLKGVTIGKNSLIGANSVVTSNIPQNVIAAGNPCRVIRQLDDKIVGKLDECSYS